MNFEKLLKNDKIKRILASVVAGLVITSVVADYSQRVMADITNSVVRLHIMANSDTEADQELKLKVRDDVSEFLAPLLAQSQGVEDTKSIISQNIKNIEEEAEKSIKKHGYTYGATAVLGNFYFPQKSYENTTFPAGNYDALRIVIGEGKGHNWWCVLYPQLCFTVSENGELPLQSHKKLKNVLTDDEYNLITSKSNIKLKLKILELFSNQ